MKYFFFPCSIGVRCQNQKRFALAVVDERGAKRLRSGRTKNKIILWNFPFFRGISYFFCAIIALLCAFWDSTKLSSQPVQSQGLSDKIADKLSIKKQSVIISVLLLISLVLTLIAFGYVPTKLSFVFIGMSMNFALRNFLIALVKVFIFILIETYFFSLICLIYINLMAHAIKLGLGRAARKRWVREIITLVLTR